MASGSKDWIMGTVAIFIAAVFLILLALSLIYPSYRQTSGSMEPTIHTEDRVFLKRTRDVRRGDVIAFRYPLDPKTEFMKRVVGMPCDVVEIRAKQLFVNGTPLTEPYVVHEDNQTFPSNPNLPEPYRSRDSFGPYTVPAGQYFVLGDNRDRSSDSRYWGTVPADHVRGRIVLIVSPKGGTSRPEPPPVLASVPPCRSILFASPAKR